MKNLKKANQLIEEIAETYKEITPVTPKDMALFDKFFKKEPHTYGNSWTYITQGKYGIGPYGLGYKYYDGKNLSSFSVYPKLEQPDLLCVYWTRPMGLHILDIITKYSKELLKTKKTPTYIKKIFKRQLEYLRKKGFETTKKFPWHSSCPSEDDSYPEIIVDAKKTVENNSHRETIRNALKRYRGIKEIVKINDITNAKQKQLGWRIAQNFFKQQISALSGNISTSNDYYNPIFMSKSTDHELFLISQNNSPRGVFDLNRLDRKYYSIYMSLMLRQRLHNLNEFSIIYRCYRILKKGGSYLNMGGSETEGLHKFKSKFSILSTNQMYWATCNTTIRCIEYNLYNYVTKIT